MENSDGPNVQLTEARRMKSQAIADQLTTLSIILFATVCSGAANAAKPAYKCEKLDSSIEQMICQDEKLDELDRKVQAEYNAALKNVGKNELKTLKAVQRGWIKGRNDCWKDQDKRQCVIDNYNIRITELQIQAGSVMVPKASVFDCGDQKMLTVYFYNNTQLPTAVLNFADEQINAYQALAASGAKYDGRNVSVWNKGNEAALTWYDKTYQCKEVPSSNL
jgi:uncharacterized protein